MKTKIASQESDIFLSDVLTNSTSNIYLLLFFFSMQGLSVLFNGGIDSVLLVLSHDSFK